MPSMKTNSSRTRRRAVAGLALAVLAAGCGVSGCAKLTATQQPAEKTEHRSTSSTTSSTSTTSTTEPQKVDPDLQEVLDDTGAVVELLDAYYGQNIEGYQPPDQLILYVT